MLKLDDAGRALQVASYFIKPFIVANGAENVCANVLDQSKLESTLTNNVTEKHFPNSNIIYLQNMES